MLGDVDKRTIALCGVKLESRCCKHSWCRRDNHVWIFERVTLNFELCFGCVLSYIEPQHMLFQCRQRDRESLHEFSHCLMALMENFQCKNPNTVPNSDVVLHEQFVEYVKDKMLLRV